MDAKYNKFIITAHETPDGDAIGSEYALFKVLQKMGKKVLIFNSDPIPANYKFLDKNNDIKQLDNPELLPADLNDYALIAESIGISSIVGLGLCYYEPRTELQIDDVGKVILDRGFNMGFEAQLMKVKLDPVGVVLPLLAEVRRLYDIKRFIPRLLWLNSFS